MKQGDFVIWTDRVGEIVTVYNDGLNLVIRAEVQKTPTAKKNIESFNKYEVFTVSSNDATVITKEVADIMVGDI
jgi:hypothetical protein